MSTMYANPAAASAAGARPCSGAARLRSWPSIVNPNSFQFHMFTDMGTQGTIKRPARHLGKHPT